MADFGALTPLGELRWHWGSAYVIDGTLGRWFAERRDDGHTLTAGDPAKLRLAIIDDYFRKPVPRYLRTTTWIRSTR
jgi:hypothetical protein